jgi:hypothetical protein
MSVPAKDWNEWAHSAGFREGVVERMRRLHVPGDGAQRLWLAASADASPAGLEALDAAVCFEGTGAAIRPDPAKDLWRLFECSRAPSCVGPNRVPAEHWFARDGAVAQSGEAQVVIRGAVMVQLHGRTPVLR